MAKNVTLGDLRSEARERANMTGSGFIKNPVWNGWINKSIQRLYNILVRSFGEDYYFKEADISIVSGTEEYDLPTDFYKLLGVDLKIGTKRQDRIGIEKFLWKDRNRYSYRPGGFVGRSFRYRMMGGSIIFVPEPTGANTVTLSYIRTATDLVVDSDSFDGINGFEEWVILDVAIKARIKEESDVSDLVLERNIIREEIKSDAKARDRGEGNRVSDVNGFESIDDYGTF